MASQPPPSGLGATQARVQLDLDPATTPVTRAGQQFAGRHGGAHASVAVLGWLGAEARMGLPHVRITAPVGSRVGASLTLAGSLVASAEATGPLPGPDPARVALMLLDSDLSPRAIGPGERLTVLVDGRPALEATAPFISARSVPETDRVVGRTDILGDLLLVARRPDGGRFQRRVTPEASGVLSISVAGELDLTVDSKTELRRANGGVVFRAPAVAERATVTLGSSRIEVLAPADTVVAATLRPPGGRPVADGSGVADAAGRLAIDLEADGGERPRVDPGQEIIIAWLAAGPPVDAAIPEIDVRVDPERGRLSGIALPDTPIVVEAQTAGGQVRISARSDATGRFDVGLPIDIAPGASGTVGLALDSRVWLVQPWMLPEVEVAIGSHWVSGAGVTGQSVEADLRRAGVTVGRGEASVGASEDMRAARVAPGCKGCAWSLELRDEHGYPTPVYAGDVLRIAIDRAAFETEAPAFTLEANPESGRLFGSAPAGAEVRLEAEAIGGGEPNISETVADGSGRFSTGAPAPGGGPRPGGLVTASLRAEGVLFRTSHRAWNARIDLDTGLADGYALPGELVSLEVTTADMLPVGTAETTADAQGRYTLQLRDAASSSVAPSGGARLSLISGGRATESEVPDIALEADPILDVISGDAPAGGLLELEAQDPRGVGGARAAWSGHASAAGRFDASIGDMFDVSAGDRISVAHWADEGIAYFRRQTLPLLVAPAGGDRIQGIARPSARTAVAVLRSGAVVASGQADADANGFFEVRFGESGSTGEDLALATGDTVTAEFSHDEVTETLSTVVLEVSSALDGPGRRVYGRAPSGRPTYLRARGPDLPDGLPALRLTSATDGGFSRALPGTGALPAATVADVEADDPVGHRTVRRSVVPYVDLVIGMPEVNGLHMPRTALSVTLSDGPTPVAAARGASTTDGSFRLRLEPAGDRVRPVVVAPGLTLRLAPQTGDPSDAPEIGFVVPALSIEIDAEDGSVYGIAPPYAALELQLTFAGRPPSLHAARAGAGGSWRLDASAMPPGVDPLDMRRAEVAYRLPEGHRLAAVATPRLVPEPSASPTRTGTPSIGSPTVTPTHVAPVTSTAAPPSGRVFLPLALRQRELR